ncbi:MAG TPA: Ig-like domain-containing protein [Verrucomicrobiae bacterium]|nr:Ig-like domain-containing protein [Verrucomicrobiae bacterium]
MKTKSVFWHILASLFAMCILTSQTTYSQITNLTLQISKGGANAPAVLSWDSKTNEIYTILYSTNLADGFLPAVTDFPNQGTNTFWSDTGTESELGSRSSSADSEAAIRFYRLSVKSYTSNSFPAIISFSNVADSSVLSGLTNVVASAISPSNLISGKLSVDGNDAAFDSGGSYNFPLETRLYPNGTHRLTVTVEDNGDSDSTGPDDPGVPAYGDESSASYAAQNISVTFNNFLSDVRLKYQGYRPELGQTQEVHGTWASAQDWEVDITPANDTNTIYRTFTGSEQKFLCCGMVWIPTEIHWTRSVSRTSFTI